MNHDLQNNESEYAVQLDIYWKSVAMYAVTLLVYIVVRGVWDSTIQTGTVIVDASDPVIVLLSVFIVVTIITLITNIVSQRRIIVSEKAITFVSEFHERAFTIDEIDKIVVGRDRRIKARGVFSMIKVHIKKRRRAIRIRPAVYENEEHLVRELLNLRDFIGQRTR